MIARRRSAIQTRRVTDGSEEVLAIGTRAACDATAVRDGSPVPARGALELTRRAWEHPRTCSLRGRPCGCELLADWVRYWRCRGRWGRSRRWGPCARTRRR